MEHLENVEIPFLTHWQPLLYHCFLEGIPTAFNETIKPMVTQHFALL